MNLRLNKKLFPWIIGIGVFVLFLILLIIFSGNNPTSPMTISPPPALP